MFWQAAAREQAGTADSKSCRFLFPGALLSPQPLLEASAGVVESWLEGTRCRRGLNPLPLRIPAVGVGLSPNNMICQRGKCSAQVGRVLLLCAQRSAQRRAARGGATGVAMTNASGESKSLGGRIGGNKGPSRVLLHDHSS